jgi:prenyltransferase beta subunit
MNDIGDVQISSDMASSGYFPGDKIGGVINASAYRAFLLTKASIQFSEERYWERAKSYINFILRTQHPNGSWPYAAEGARDFIDHFHTCFVLKALAKIEKATLHKGCHIAIEKGIRFYLEELFDKKGLPKPFSKAPRLTVYRNELYDYAECINIGILLNGRFPELDRRTHHVIDDLIERWQKQDGSFRSRKLIFGWDNIPMHRWGQSQIFRSLCLFLTSKLSQNKQYES